MQAGIRVKVLTFSIVAAIGLAWSAPFGQAADISQEMVVKYLLTTVKAFRAVYVKNVIEQAKKAGVKPNENWTKDDHAIMLPAQLVKAAGAEIKDYELGLIGLTPIYKSNLPKTDAETDALKQMIADPNKTILTFADGDQFKGLAADFAIVQGCAHCHNTHPSSPKKDFKKGDLMGAIVVRLKK
jgi:Protein of unknown function (DUF3365)